MTLYRLDSGHTIGVNAKVSDGVRFDLNGLFERGQGVLKTEDACKLLAELAGLLDMKLMPIAPPGTAGEVSAVVDEE